MVSSLLSTPVLTTRFECLRRPGESAGPDAEPSALHSGNLGDIIYSLPAARALGVARYVLNVCRDPGMWQRSLTERGARFLAPLLLAQDPIQQVDIVRVPVTLRAMQGELVSDGLPLEGTEPRHAGVTHLFDRFRWQPDLCSRPLVESHAAAVGVSVDGADAWLGLPDLEALRAAAAAEDAPVVVSLTPRYRSRPTGSFAALLAGFPRVIKVGVEADREALAGIPGELVTADDALELARLIASARFFIGSPSLPFAIAEGLKVPRLVDVFAPMPNAVPLGPLGWRLSADAHQAVAQAQALWRQQWDAAVLGADECPVEPAPAEAERPPRGSGVGDSAPAPEAVAPWSPRPANIGQAQRVALEAEHQALEPELETTAPAVAWMRELAEGLRGHVLFDADWYRSQVALPDGVDALLHYFWVGSAMGYTPHPLFDGAWYLRQHPDVAAAGLEPLVHYVRRGAAEGRDPHPLFDTQLYLEQCGDDAEARAQPLLHYLTTGGGLGYRTHPLFDAAWYRATYPWAAATQFPPLEHYLRVGAAQGLSPNPEFDAAWYLAQVPGLDPRRENPLVHYCGPGRRLGLYTHPKSEAVTLASVQDALDREDQRASLTVSAGAVEPVAIVAHLHYSDLLWELLLYLRQLPVPFRLYLSTGAEADRAMVLSAAERALPGVPIHCQVTPNRGRDWGPLLAGFREAWSHPFLCHVHGKRSGHFVFGDQWRRYLLDNLLGSRSVLTSILTLFGEDSRLGLVFPETFAAVSEHHQWGSNRDNTRALLTRLGLDAAVVDERPLVFPAGSMFWCRTRALDPLWRAGLDWEDFPQEPVGEDGTLMHALERALVFIVHSAGFHEKQVRLPQVRGRAVPRGSE